MTAPIAYTLTEGAALMALDAAATCRVRVMLQTQSWRDAANWLRGLEMDVDRCADVEAILALAGRIERGER